MNPTATYLALVWLKSPPKNIAMIKVTLRSTPYLLTVQFPFVDETLVLLM
jgi:hypothetical protein